MNRFTPASRARTNNCKVASRFCVLLRTGSAHGSWHRGHRPPHEKSNRIRKMSRRTSFSSATSPSTTLSESALRFQSRFALLPRERSSSANHPCAPTTQCLRQVRTNKTRSARNQCLHTGQLVTRSGECCNPAAQLSLPPAQTVSTVPLPNPRRHPSRGYDSCEGDCEFVIQPAMTTGLPFVNAR